MESFGDRLDKYKGFGPGFDLCRIVLAYLVLVLHTEEIVYNDYTYFDAWPVWIFNSSIVPMFFALSGFLVAGSAMRLNIPNFFINRGLRIFPALIVEIALSAIVLGGVFTTLSISKYYTHPDFFAYFTNIFGFIRYELPGVFASNPHALIVNGSLWTVPFEMICYVCMAGFMLFGAVKKPRYLIAFLVAYMATAQIVALTYDALVQSHIGAILARGFTGRQVYLVPSFVCGILAYAYRTRIIYSNRIMIAALAVIVLVGLLGNASWRPSPVIATITIPIFTYLIVFTGLTRFPRLPFFGRGDYSYGIYLYAYPIQQGIIALNLVVFSWWSHVLVSVTLVTAFAVFSWHRIEKPILQLRKTFSVVAREKVVQGEDAAAAALKSHGAHARRDMV